jgi:rhodanese-related sulfurtransferase
MRNPLKSGLANLAAAALLAGYAVSGHGDGSFENISPKQAAAQFSEKKAVIVDVREDGEWQEQHIPGAIHIPLAQLPARLSELEPYKNSPIITQCRSGGRSAKAAAQLKAAGFSNVYNLDGGIQAWEKAGLTTQ